MKVWDARSTMLEEEKSVTFTNAARVAALVVFAGIGSLDGARADTLTLRSDRVASGGSTLATLTLDRAPTARVPYSVALSGTNAAQAPTRLDVLAGQTRAEFPVTAAPAGTEQFVDILVTEAANGRVAGRTRLVVTPPALNQFSLNKSSVVGGTPGSTVTGTVTLDGTAAGHGASVALGLSCSNTGCSTQEWSFPATVLVPAGARNASFNFSPPVLRSGGTQATVIASFGGATKSATVVNDFLRPQSLVISPATISGAQAATATLTLNAPAFSNYGLRLTCSKVLGSTVPINKPCRRPFEGGLTLAVPEGQSTVVFQLTNTQPGPPESVTVKAENLDSPGGTQATLSVAP
jgi:hypothetical protein